MIPPLSLYIHLPWCVQKCPYCDFNSHAVKAIIPEKKYIEALIADLRQDLALIPARPIESIFFGGGTPSLFSGASIHDLMSKIRELVKLQSDCEITLEANPGTIEQERFRAYREAGINRLSIGVQSFQDTYLKALGRIHDGAQAEKSVETARKSGFDNINLDIMHGLPNQTTQDAIIDLTKAISLNTPHLSWYQLTLEPNTQFYKKPPILPDENQLADIEQQGLSCLVSAGFSRYEISAYTRGDRPSRHNLNYWLFGDYLAIGAGAHSKLTLENGEILRLRKMRLPHDYLNPSKNFIAEKEYVTPENRIFEFMLNALRLFQPISFELFEQRTGLSRSALEAPLQAAVQRDLITLDSEAIHITPLGHRFLNDLTGMFLPHPP